MDRLFDVNRSTYDRIAQRFAQINAMMPPNLIAGAEKMLNYLDGPDQLLLDLGCGTGRDLAWFQAHRLPVIGADLSLGMLREAQQVTQAALFQTNLLWQGFATSLFSGVWCIAALLHLPKALAPQALLEIRRILKPGGWLYLSLQKGDDEGFESASYGVPSERFFARYQPGEVQTLLLKAGFSLKEMGENVGSRHWIWFIAERGSP